MKQKKITMHKVLAVSFALVSLYIFAAEKQVDTKREVETKVEEAKEREEKHAVAQQVAEGLVALPNVLADIVTGYVPQYQEIELLRVSEGVGVVAVAWSPDGKQLVSGGRDGIVRIWDVATGKQLKELLGHKGSIYVVAWSPDGKQLVSAGHDGIVRIWDVETGQVKELRRHGESVASVAWSLDGKQVMSAGHDETVRVWDVETGEQVKELRGSGTYLGMGSVLWSPDGKQVVLVGSDRTVSIYDMETGKQVKELHRYGEDLRFWSVEVAWSPDGKQVAAVARDMSVDWTVRIWNVETGEQIRELHVGDVVRSIAWSPEGHLLALGHQDPIVSIWDVAAARQVAELRGHRNLIYSVAWSPSGTQLASASEDGTIRIWNMVDVGALVREVQSKKKHKGAVKKALLCFKLFRKLCITLGDYNPVGSIAFALMDQQFF